MSIQESKEAPPNRLFHFSKEGWQKDDCTDRAVQDLVVQYFKAICEDAIYRSKEVKDNKNILNEGFWYANEYLSHLTCLNEEKRLNWLKKKGHFYHGFPPKNFLAEPDETDNAARLTGTKGYHYQLKGDVLPSKGLEGLLPEKNNRFFFIDCHIAMQIAHFCALRVIFGEEGFNEYFQRVPLILTPDKNPSLMGFYSFREDEEPPQYGESCFFQNVPIYHIKHMDGEAGGFHVIRTLKEGEPKYAGFGLPSVESSTEEIYTLLADEFNKDPVPLTDLLSKEFANRRTAISYAQLHPREAERARRTQLTAEDVSEIAKRYPEKVGLQKPKFKLSFEKIQRCLQ